MLSWLRPVWKSIGVSAGLATPSSRRRVDGEQVDATISTQVGDSTARASRSSRSCSSRTSVSQKYHRPTASSRGRARRRGNSKNLRASRGPVRPRPVPACHSRRTRRSARETGRPTSPRFHIIDPRTNHKYQLCDEARGTVCDGPWPGHEWRCLLHLNRSPLRALFGCVPCGSCGLAGASAAVLGFL